MNEKIDLVVESGVDAGFSKFVGNGVEHNVRNEFYEGDEL